MDIIFKGKYKSITDFVWRDIPPFVVITGPNGSGKSQLLRLIYQTLINDHKSSERVTILNSSVKGGEVVFKTGEWNLNSAGTIGLAQLQSRTERYYNLFIKNRFDFKKLDELRISNVCQELLKKIGKTNPKEVDRETFDQYFPEVFIEQDEHLGMKIGEIFYHFRMQELDYLAKGFREEAIREKLGNKPWKVMEKIVQASNLPFSFSTPEECGMFDRFLLKITNTLTGDNVQFTDLSSGEKVLMSLFCLLYNSTEKQVYPKLFLLDEPDAHLHPTMSRQFIDVMNDVLVEKFNVRVIMTTHSPSTVTLVPDQSLFEMSRLEPRIRKSKSKNHSISLLTSGLVYVGKGTKYFIVEDQDDVNFYSHLFGFLTKEDLLDGTIPLVFIPASTSEKTGGKDVVKDWVKKLIDSGLKDMLGGIIDQDAGNITSVGVFKINRYSIENYLIDPIVVFGALLDKEKHFDIKGIPLGLGDETKLRFFEAAQLQRIADEVLFRVEHLLETELMHFNSKTETTRTSIKFTGDIHLEYPEWLLKRRGKTLLNNVFGKEFNNSAINYRSLFRSFRKLGFIPQEIIHFFKELQDFQV